jgi:LmbE family N-acetylglucosaminyl deacetylase
MEPDYAPSPLPSVLGGKRWLIIGAHPDDESKAVPLLVTERLPSDTVEVLTMRLCGEGRPYDRDAWTPEEAIAVRASELSSAAHMLRGHQRFWLPPHPENPGIVSNPENISRLKAILHELKPNRIVTHWGEDSHPDHLGTAALVIDTLGQLDNPQEIRLFQFGQPGRETEQPSFLPSHFVDLSDPGALAYVLWARFMHRSQTTEYLMPQYLRYFWEHGRQIGKAYGAGFVVRRFLRGKEMS